jgi:two-component system cell cycle response regulator
MATQINVLIVEDSPTQTKLLRSILEEKGYIVDSAPNGLKALECIRRKKPKLVITDIIMPEMDGFALCKAIKTNPDLTHIPVMLLTSLSDPRDVIKALQAGAESFLTKPYESDILISRIEHIFTNQELRKNWDSDSDIEIMFGDEKFAVHSDRMQVVDLLISTYENAVQKNSELHKAHNDLIGVYRQLEQKNIDLEKLNQNLTHALAEVKTLSGLLPICAHCKKIREDDGYWNQIESYMAKRVDVEFTHGICPECAKKFFPEVAAKLKRKLT